MAQLLSMVEIRKRYPKQWVVVAYEQLDEDMNVVQGEVLAHSADRDVVYRRLLSLKGRPLALEYTGPLPEDMAVVL